MSTTRANATPEFTPALTSDALTIATWNLQFLPVVGSECCDHVPKRLTKITDNLRAANVDVIALNEVFTDHAKNTLSDLLADTYPYQVTFVDGDGDKEGVDTAEDVRAMMRSGVIEGGKQGLTPKQDSGLMLFSKHPFQPFPDNDLKLVPKDRLKATANGANWPHVAFTQFGICEGFLLPSSGKSTDCMANKGAALVRIAKPGAEAETIYNVVFTHFEAGTNDPELGPLIRDLAIDTAPTAYIQSLLGKYVGDRPNERAIVLGDLNINGAASSDRVEWLAKFTQKGRLFADNFSDSWDAMRPPSVDIGDFDPGLTNRVFDETQSRLDYILFDKKSIEGRSTDTACIQHVRTPPSLYLSAAGDELSDHRPVVATINRQAKHCSPQSADVIDDSMFLDGPLIIIGEDAHIVYPEGAQWYLLAGTGTYSIAGWTKDEPVNVDVYSTTNMSVPIHAYRDETRDISFTTDHENVPHVSKNTRVFASSDKPLLIKVTMANGSTGPYNLGIKKHVGESKEDAIVLFPGVSQSASVGTNSGSPIERWFRFDTDGPVSGAAQTLEFVVTPSVNTSAVSRLVTPEGSTVLHSNKTGFQRRDANDNFRTYYLVSSPDRVSEDAKLTVSWKTNLQMMVIQQRAGDTSVLTAIHETGWGFLGSDDNVRMNFIVDGVQLFEQPHTCDQVTPNDCVATGYDGRPLMGSFDSGTVAQVDPPIPCSVGFLEALEVVISEEEWMRKDQVLSGYIRGTSLLRSDERYRGAQHVLLDSDAGEYRLKFYLTRGTQGGAREGYAPAFQGPQKRGFSCHNHQN